MQVWARYHHTAEQDAAEGNVGDSLANENVWPLRREHRAVVEALSEGPDEAEGGAAVRAGARPGAAHGAGGRRHGGDHVQIELIGLGQLDVLREKLAAGRDVTVGVKLHSWATAGEPGAKYVIGEKDPTQIHGFKQHQVLLAGYAMTPNGYYYLVHNSWGPKWGDNGYAWMHEDVLKAQTFGKEMYVPDLQPKQVADLRLRAGTGLQPRCGAGMAPDSISAICAGKCPDGSPRHNNNMCAAPGQCPAGTVNLTGVCLMAAPRTAGTDPGSQVSWECADGGCAYVIPAGRLGCNAQQCEVSCPAPAFRLATTPKGLACVE